MPASRWQTSFQDIMQWNEEDENELLSLIVPSMFSKTINKEMMGTRRTLRSRKMGRSIRMCYPSFPCEGWSSTPKLPSR